MHEREPGPLVEHPLTGMEACVRVSFLVMLGERATEADLEEKAAIAGSLPDPCSLCPRLTAAGEGPIDHDAGGYVQPPGRPCMIPREILVRALRSTEAYNGYKKTG